MFGLPGLFGRHEIDEWRDDVSLLAASVLNQAAAGLVVSLDSQIREAGWFDSLINQSAFIASRIAPAVRAEIDPLVAGIMEHANLALAAIVDHQAVWHDRPSGREPLPSGFDGWQDLAVAAGPLAGGAAVAVALPAMAVTTTTAWLGLVTVSAVSWPVVAIGGAVAGVAVATGVINTAKIGDSARARLREKVREYVVSTVIEGRAGHPAILTQIHELIDRTASAAKQMR